jgi:endonuclease/exonuclease/phosphatase family metal-dependent hydrolase
VEITMKLVSYNIQYTKGRDGRFDTARIVESLQDADVIALQEVERNWPRSAMADQVADLAALLPEYYWVYCPAFDMDASEAAADGTVVNRRRQFGNMLLARWPIMWSRNYVLPKIGTVEKFNMDAPALEGVIDTPGGPLRAWSIHLSAVSPRERLMQIDYLLDLHNRAGITGGSWTGEPMIRGDRAWAAGADEPPMPLDAIWMGDFNASPDSAEYSAIVGLEDAWYGHVQSTDRLADSWTLAGHGRDERASYPDNDEGKGAVHLDYCFVSPGFAKRVRSCRIDMDAAGSDHQPVWTEIDL